MGGGWRVCHGSSLALTLLFPRELFSSRSSSETSNTLLPQKLLHPSPPGSCGPATSSLTREVELARKAGSWAPLQTCPLTRSPVSPSTDSLGSSGLEYPSAPALTSFPKDFRSRLIFPGILPLSPQDMTEVSCHRSLHSP